MRRPRSVNATHTVSPLAVMRAYESLHLPVTASRHERGGAAASDLMVCAKTSTSATDSLQLRQSPMCSWISSRSVEASSPVRMASMRVRTDLHRMGDSFFLQRIPQELQGAKDFSAQRGLGRADGPGDFSVGHVFHESKDDQLARFDGQGAHRAAEQLGILAALRVLAVMADERTEAAVVERLERLLQRARFTTVDGDRQILFGGLGAPHGLTCPRVLHASLLTRPTLVSFGDGRWRMADGRWQMADGGWPGPPLLPSAICHLPSAICHLPSGTYDARANHHGTRVRKQVRRIAAAR